MGCFPRRLRCAGASPPRHGAASDTCSPFLRGHQLHAELGLWWVCGARVMAGRLCLDDLPASQQPVADTPSVPISAWKEDQTMKAILNGHVVAESNDIVESGGYAYFPPGAMRL